MAFGREIEINTFQFIYAKKQFWQKMHPREYDGTF